MCSHRSLFLSRFELCCTYLDQHLQLFPDILFLIDRSVLMMIRFPWLQMDCRKGERERDREREEKDQREGKKVCRQIDIQKGANDKSYEQKFFFQFYEPNLSVLYELNLSVLFITHCIKYQKYRKYQKKTDALVTITIDRRLSCDITLTSRLTFRVFFQQNTCVTMWEELVLEY